MTDRELLVQAAKAAGLLPSPGNDVDISPDGGLMICGGKVLHWNPLTDDGDAMRLAVHLRFEVDNYYGEVASGEEGERRQTLIGDDTDRCAATRRAIVRAAAEIGRALDAIEAKGGGR